MDKRIAILALVALFVLWAPTGFDAIKAIGFTRIQEDKPTQVAAENSTKPIAVVNAKDRSRDKMEKGDLSLAKRLIAPANCPAAVGPYSPAVAAGGFLFVSGQIPIDPQSNRLITDSFDNQVRQTLENLQCVVESAGLTLNDIVKVTIYLVDMNRFADLNAIYEEYFAESKPARACIQVAALPKGVAVEMDAIAYFPKE